MAWIEITEDDILTVMAGPELEGIREAALRQNQPDPVAPTIKQVTDLVRGYVGGCPRNALGAGNTIPEKLLGPSLDLLAVRIPLRVSSDPGEGRKQASVDAINYLKMVAACDIDIEEPAAVSPESSGMPSPRISGRRRNMTREDQDGI